jgi:enoyl-[acyl-carrier protein] reductase II
VLLKPEGAPALRALRTPTTEALERGEGNAMAALAAGVADVYFGGRIEKGVALSGQVVGRIHAIRPVADVIRDTVRGFHETVERLAKLHLTG